jgi:hypothetical protein
MYHTKTYTVFIMIVLFSFTQFYSYSYADQIGKSYREAEKLSNGEKLKRASKEVSQMQQVLKFALKRLRTAYQNKDIIQTNCIKDKLSTIKGLLRISEEADVSLREAIVTGQNSLIDHEYVKINMASQRIRLSQTQIDGCVGDINGLINSQKSQRLKPEIFDESVQNFTPNSEERNVIVYDTIASERPEAITASE